jgi:hypothetical protein
VAGASNLVSLGFGRAVDAVVFGCANSFLSLLAYGLLVLLLGPPIEEIKKETVT